LFLRLKQSQINLLKEETYRRNPIEACALLFGKSSKDVCFVKKVVVAANDLSSTVEFAINPRLVVAELKKAETEGLELVGFFHSHPSAPYPSVIDLKNMKLWANALWLIFSLTEGKIAAYLMRNNILEELQLKIESESQ
jgi:proteasome lid subunit RPN8/RPN11